MKIFSTNSLITINNSSFKIFLIVFVIAVGILPRYYFAKKSKKWLDSILDINELEKVRVYFYPLEFKILLIQLNAFLLTSIGVYSGLEAFASSGGIIFLFTGIFFASMFFMHSIVPVCAIEMGIKFYKFKLLKSME